MAVRVVPVVLPAWWVYRSAMRCTADRQGLLNPVLRASRRYCSLYADPAVLLMLAS